MQAGPSAPKLILGCWLKNVNKNAVAPGQMLFGTRAGASVSNGAAAKAQATSAEVSGQFSIAAAEALAKKAPAFTEAAMSAVKLIPGKALPRPFAMTSRSLTTSAAENAAAATTEAAKPKGGLLRNLAKVIAGLVAATAVAVMSPVAADAPERWQLGFQDPATATMQGIVDLHNDITFFMVIISALVIYLGNKIVYKFHYTRQPMPEKVMHQNTLELIWTILPCIVIMMIAIPSLTLIYSLDQHTDRPGLTVKIIGRQWYWSYEMHDHLQHKLLDPDRLVAIAEKSLVEGVSKA
jgi:hypothetical protein